MSAAIFANEMVPVVVIGPPVNPVPVATLVTVPVLVSELQPNPVFVVHIRALLAPLHDGIAMAAGTADPLVPLAITVLAPIDGKSPITIPLNAGVVAPPEVGPAQKVFALSFALVSANVPDVVTGDPETVNSAGADIPTEVTVPVPAADIHDGTPDAFSDRTLVPLLFPVRLVHPDGPR